ncbi:MAG: 50S ribosomal protein L25 [Alphaproteobacteria bacterium]|nr:50S ribosomal protein L25 [Alphaproteobacteria bacterium]MCB9791841.1 50S ribosomal protein L25 [Alphaproteobacteria bacterium]
MNTVPLPASARQDFGKGAARKLRATGQIPGVIYRSGEAPLHIALDPFELRKLYRRTQNINSVLELDVDGDKRVVLLKDRDVHPVSRDILHVDFFEIRQDEPVTIKVLIEPTGRAKGTTIGGKLQVLRRKLDVRCLPKDIPASLPVDVTPMDLGDMIQVSEIPAPEGCTILFEQDFNVIRVAGRRVVATPADAAAADGKKKKGK